MLGSVRFGVLALPSAMALCLALDARGAERVVTSTLEWTAPPAKGCPDADGLARAVESRLGRRVFVGPAQADVRLHGEVASAGESWRATLVLLDREGRELGTRELRSRAHSCAAFAETLPVVVALLIDLPRSRIQLDLPPPELSPPPSPSPSAARSTSDVVAASSTGAASPNVAPSTPAWQLGLAVLAEAATGLVPDWGWGLALQLDVRPPGLPMASVWISQLGPASRFDPSTGVLVSLRTAGLQICPSLLRAAVTLHACGGLGMGLLSARGFGYDENVEQERLYAGARAGLRVGIPLFGPAAARLDIAAELPLWRDRLVGEQVPGLATEAFQVADVGAHIGLGLAARSE